jgi:hypothetical protein
VVPRSITFPLRLAVQGLRWGACSCLPAIENQTLLRPRNSSGCGPDSGPTGSHALTRPRLRVPQMPAKRCSGSPKTYVKGVLTKPYKRL